jgi:hypothetical protein
MEYECYDGVKRADKNATIVGPSYIYADMDVIEKFLLAKRDSGRLPDVVSWHFQQPETLASNVERLRSFMKENGIPQLPITINEVVYPKPQN